MLQHRTVPAADPCHTLVHKERGQGRAAVPVELGSVSYSIPIKRRFEAPDRHILKTISTDCKKNTMGEEETNPQTAHYRHRLSCRIPED